MRMLKDYELMHVSGAGDDEVVEADIVVVGHKWTNNDEIAWGLAHHSAYQGLALYGFVLSYFGADAASGLGALGINPRLAAGIVGAASVTGVSTDAASLLNSIASDLVDVNYRLIVQDIQAHPDNYNQYYLDPVDGMVHEIPIFPS